MFIDRRNLYVQLDKRDLLRVTAYVKEIVDCCISVFIGAQRRRMGVHENIRFFLHDLMMLFMKNGTIRPDPAQLYSQRNHSANSATINGHAVGTTTEPSHVIL